MSSSPDPGSGFEETAPDLSAERNERPPAFPTGSYDAPTDRDLADDHPPGDVPMYPAAWGPLSHVATLRNPPTSVAVNRFLDEVGHDVVVKAFRTQRTDLDAIWQEWDERVSRGAPLLPLLRTHVGDGVAYEMTPFRPLGSLLGLLTAGAWPHARRPRSELVKVIDTIDQALHSLHELRPDGTFLVHRDVKPSNILVRALEPIAVELSDTGTVALLDELDPAPTPTRTTIAYSAPESRTLVHPPLDYWSLGITVAQLGTGRHPYQLESGLALMPGVIENELAQRDPVIPAGLDPDLQELVLGLLERNSARRWGHAEISQWPYSDRPEARPPGEEDRTPRPAGPSFTDPTGDRPGAADRESPDDPEDATDPEFAFAGGRYRSREGLARAFADAWDEAVSLMLGREIDRLIAWLGQVHPDVATALVDVKNRRQSNEINAQRGVAEAIRALDPAAPAVFCGQPAHREGLRWLADSAKSGSIPAHRVIRLLYDSRSLEVLARAPGQGDLRLVDEQWRYLTRVALGLVERHVPVALDEADPVVHGLVLRAVLSEKGARDLRRQAQSHLSDRILEVPWYRVIAHTGGDTDAAAHHAVMVFAASWAQAESVAVRPEVDAWARTYLADVATQRAARRRTRSRTRWRVPGALVALISAAVTLFVVAAQTWNLLDTPFEVFALATASFAVVAMVIARTVAASTGALLLELLGRCGLVGSALGCAAALVMAELARPGPGLAAAWWIWGVLQLFAVIVFASSTAARPTGRRATR